MKQKLQVMDAHLQRVHSTYPAPELDENMLDNLTKDFMKLLKQLERFTKNLSQDDLQQLELSLANISF